MAKNKNMAELTCTIEEFHKFIGPRIRNVIQSLTKERKKELNYICQGCNQRKELEAAHVKGSDRKVIIEKVLEKYIIDEENKVVRVYLAKIEEEIVASHKPVDNYIKFLCSKCHTEYDSKKAD
jgi:uncharacterized membrane-anchored protein